MKDLTVVERAAVIRASRLVRDQMRIDLGHLHVQAKLGDKVAASASVTLQAEIDILSAAIRVLWCQQPGATGPPPE